MDNIIHARFWRVSTPEAGVTDFHDILTEDVVGKAGDREWDLGEGVVVRLERCAPDGEFLEGEFCRVQTLNLPPQAGPDGLEATKLEAGRGFGHVAAFQYHLPTRVLLLQRNASSVTHGRLSLYLAATKPGRFFTCSAILAGDAMERFKRKKPRSFSVTFAGADNLAAFDDDGLAAAQGAKLIAEAYGGVRVTIDVSVGKSRKLKLDKTELLAALEKLTGLSVVKKLKVKAEEDGKDDLINFLNEQLQYEKTVPALDPDPSKNYGVRRLLLRAAFADNLADLKKRFQK